MIYKLALVGLGGGAGSMLRFLLQRAFNASFPYGTFIVNITGCLLIGLLWGLGRGNGSETGRLLLVTGFCGGFTTFSAFTQESVELLEQHKAFTFLAYCL
ncbi:MAG TPA: CrcB family protein, partial [Flavisolibacter sp.]